MMVIIKLVKSSAIIKLKKKRFPLWTSLFLRHRSTIYLLCIAYIYICSCLKILDQSVQTSIKKYNIKIFSTLGITTYKHFISLVFKYFYKYSLPSCGGLSVACGIEGTERHKWWDSPQYLKKPKSSSTFADCIAWGYETADVLTDIFHVV